MFWKKSQVNEIFYKYDKMETNGTYTNVRKLGRYICDDFRSGAYKDPQTKTYYTFFNGTSQFIQERIPIHDYDPPNPHNYLILSTQPKWIIQSLQEVIDQKDRNPEIIYYDNNKSWMCPELGKLTSWYYPLQFRLRMRSSKVTATFSQVLYGPSTPNIIKDIDPKTFSVLHYPVISK